jgi:hypothetical protein
MRTYTSKNSMLVSKGGKDFWLSEVVLADALRIFVTGLVGLTSCFNQRYNHFIKCNFLTKRQDFSRAEQYLVRVGLLRKRDQDMLCKELVNARVSRVTG